MVDPQSLYATARMLLGDNNKGAPNQTRLRRAISTAYYAMFHTILRSASDSFVGVKYRSTARYETVYRGFEHGKMKEVCREVDKATLSAKAAKAMGGNAVSQQIRDVASAFITLQLKRHWADYAPSGKVTRLEAKDLIGLAERAADQLKVADSEERRNFLAYLMHGSRG